MKYWTEYEGNKPKICGRKNKLDNTIYTFDIETTSYLVLNSEQIPAEEYLNLTDKQQQESTPMSCMYIWQFSIDDEVYYGRTWEEFISFLDLLEQFSPEKKVVFVHNLSFEFQYICSVIRIKEVLSRKSRKVMSALCEDYNILFRCSLMMSNVKLAKLPDIFQLPVQKKVGDLDYKKIRTPATTLTEKELGYCEFDCLVVYEYIKREIETYKRVDRIPLTSTGKVRKELQRIVLKDPAYKRVVGKQINTRPSVYNMLIEAFAGGYTHANFYYADEVLENVDSFDETSAYPYVLVTHKFPASQFKECYIKKREDMLDYFAYLMRVKFTRIRSKYHNNFISVSKCNNIVGVPKTDNGRIISAKEIEITLTDVDFKFILDTYDVESYEIQKCFYATYDYLPVQYINFILDKYVNKTKFKNVQGKELEYQLNKGSFNSLYGMTVTNMIRDDVTYSWQEGWEEKELTDDAIYDKLCDEKKKSFLSFAWGVWCTAYARDNLLRRVIDLDEYVAYCDTDSIKLVQGYDRKIFEEYNKSVEEKIRKVSELLEIPFDRYAPTDTKGEAHLLGIFESETGKGRKYTYDKFITQGAKKYAFEKDGEIEITVSGVPKCGAKCLDRIEEFRDNLVFDYKYTNKNVIMYNDCQEEFDLVDYNGVKYRVSDRSGVCLLPTTYKLGKALEYASLLTDNSTERAKFRNE